MDWSTGLCSLQNKTLISFVGRVHTAQRPFFRDTGVLRDWCCIVSYTAPFFSLCFSVEEMFLERGEQSSYLWSLFCVREHCRRRIGCISALLFRSPSQAWGGKAVIVVGIGIVI